jgi:hypothetical protein
MSGFKKVLGNQGLLRINSGLIPGHGGRKSCLSGGRRLPQMALWHGTHYQATWQFAAGAAYSCGPESLGAAGAVKRR